MGETLKNYWIGVVSRAHTQLGVKGGFIQLNHGKKAPLQRLHAGDHIIIYSPREAYPDGDVLQHFTAIGTVITGDIYQVEMTPDFKPYRVDVRFVKCHESPIKPLIHKLSFIKNKTKWGATFRFGHLKIPVEDFKIIAGAMSAREVIKENAL
jgi:predicted RNA-binding protein